VKTTKATAHDEILSFDVGLNIICLMTANVDVSCVMMDRWQSLNVDRKAGRRGR